MPCRSKLTPTDIPDTPWAALTCLSSPNCPSLSHLALLWKSSSISAREILWQLVWRMWNENAAKSQTAQKHMYPAVCHTVHICVCMPVCVCFSSALWIISNSLAVRTFNMFSIVYVQILQQFFFSFSLNINQILFQIYWAHKSQMVYTITQPLPPPPPPLLRSF